MTYLAPWSIEYHGDPELIIEMSIKTLLADDTQKVSPPSSEDALQYLVSYCLLHGFGTRYLPLFRRS